MRLTASTLHYFADLIGQNINFERTCNNQNFSSRFAFSEVRYNAMMSRFITMALMGTGVLGASAYAQSQAPGYGGNPAPFYNSAQQQPGAANSNSAYPNSAYPNSAYPNSAYPGTVNYVEGAVLLDGNPLARRDVGQATIEPGEELSTATGKAEVLLTPGVFLRLDDNSAVKMISPDLTKTQVEVTRGRAAVEVDQIFPQNNLEIMDGGVSTQLLKAGYYEFSTNQPEAMVFKGKALVNEGDGRTKEVKDHHEVRLVANAELKSSGFDTRDAEDGLYNWSSLRSQYLSEANGEIASEYAGSAGFAPGWYWNPRMWDYTFIGLDPYWGPFGFGFFPPWGWYGGYWGGGYFRGHYYGGGYRGGFRGSVQAAYGGGFHGGGFAGGGVAGGGGFHGGGGGGGHR
jgi:hypothetical protein